MPLRIKLRLQKSAIPWFQSMLVVDFLVVLISKIARFYYSRGSFECDSPIWSFTLLIGLNWRSPLRLWSCSIFGTTECHFWSLPVVVGNNSMYVFPWYFVWEPRLLATFLSPILYRWQQTETTYLRLRRWKPPVIFYFFSGKLVNVISLKLPSSLFVVNRIFCENIKLKCWLVSLRKNKIGVEILKHRKGDTWFALWPSICKMIYIF